MYEKLKRMQIVSFLDDVARTMTGKLFYLAFKIFGLSTEVELQIEGLAAVFEVAELFLNRIDILILPNFLSPLL